MIRINFIVTLIFIISLNVASAASFDIGITGVNANSSQNSGVGFNLDVIFGQRGSQFVIGTTKALQKNKSGELYQSTEMLDVNYRFSNISLGAFYGGVVFDVEDFLSSWNFNRINYQYGFSLELFFRVAKNWNLGIETRRHQWIDLDNREGYTSYWLNLNYLFNL